MKKSYEDIFPRRKTLLVVVHCEDIVQVLRNVDIALTEGADGVFLINHSNPASFLLDCFFAVKQRFPDFWIGLNFLDLDLYEAFQMLPKTASGIWTDNAGIRENGKNPIEEAEYVHLFRKEHPHTGLHFGGVAFKCQEYVSDLAKAAKSAIPFVDVVTTSGVNTGIAADVRKIKLMKQAIGNFPLGIASGVTEENVAVYLPYNDGFIVSTGISDSFTETNPRKVRNLAHRIHSWVE